MDTIKITDDDAAFILGVLATLACHCTQSHNQSWGARAKQKLNILVRGKGGKTKEKIARVAEAEIELFERDLVLEIRGSKIQRRRAKKYCEGVMAQRTGPVSITEDYDDGDLTMPAA